jgi:uncharacterized protein involved in type VI secretion and phage assembly
MGMSLYDVMADISEKQVTKTETGDERVYGVMVGVVAKNYDRDMPGRVCVTIPTRDKDANELQWARQAMPSSGKGWGHYYLPEVGDQVLLAFEGGNIEKPYVLGCVPMDNNSFLTKSVDADNQIKRIVTKHGSTIRFEDNKDASGDKDKIWVETAGQNHSFTLDNENKKMVLTDKAKENVVEMNTGDGTLLIKAKSKLTIQVGESIKVIMNGENGTLKIEATDVNIAASKQFTASTDATMKLEAAQISANANSMFKAESSGMVQIAGNPIKIG